jgi:hypothetical protein
MRREGPCGDCSLPGGASAQILPSEPLKRTGGPRNKNDATGWYLLLSENSRRVRKARQAPERIKMRIETVFIAVAIGTVSLPALGQTNVNSRALADCLQAADQKYKDTWKALCAQNGKVGHCLDFMGSPQDKEFYQLRIEEMTTCSKVYDK